MHITSRTYIITLLLATLHTAVNAQIVKLINSTEQDWAGGIAGHTGENYTFEIEFSDYVKEPVAAILWVGRYAFQLTTHDTITENNTIIKRTKGTNKLRMTITVGTFRNEYAERQGEPTEEDMLKNMPKPPKTFKGKALLSYLYMGELKTFEITKIITNLPPQDYP